MTDWFARPVLHVRDVEASLRFYVTRLGFTSPWRYDEDGRPRSFCLPLHGVRPSVPGRGGQRWPDVGRAWWEAGKAEDERTANPRIELKSFISLLTRHRR